MLKWNVNFWQKFWQKPVRTLKKSARRLLQEFANKWHSTTSGESYKQPVRQKALHEAIDCFVLLLISSGSVVETGERERRKESLFNQAVADCTIVAAMAGCKWGNRPSMLVAQKHSWCEVKCFVFALYFVGYSFLFPNVKNYNNRSEKTTAVVENKVARFFWLTGYTYSVSQKTCDCVFST